MNDHFMAAAKATSRILGTPRAFAAAVLIVLVWGLSGPAFGFSDTWQLVINTGTTIVTFLMVFLIQNTQNRDALAMHLKLDELIQTMDGARLRLIGLEESTDRELNELQDEFHHVQVEEEVSGEISGTKDAKRSGSAGPRRRRTGSSSK